MSESGGRTSSATMALVERKPQSQRPGGCVGIFFQLFDWNQRFAKKKFFPKKLLLPARAKVSKKFKADEKLPVGKHLLIADENRGGFPSSKKNNGDHGVEKEHEMRSPGLVARLMGLEAMPIPVGQKDKSNKGSPRNDLKGKGGKFGCDFDGLNKEGFDMEKGNKRHELRPQKIQKTGVSERRPVTRFGAEAFQIKNVLSRSRKHHHPKLASPVKSPKIGRHSSRLIDAAARILEPGIQATNRARCSLTYSNSRDQPCKTEVTIEVNAAADLQARPSSKLSGLQTVNKQASCKNCGNFLQRMDERSVAEERMNGFDVPISTIQDPFFHELEESRPRPAIYLENEMDVVLLKTRYKPECVSAQAKDTGPSQDEVIMDSMHQSQRHDQMPDRRMFASQDSSTSVTSKHRTQRHGQILLGDRVPSRSKLPMMPSRNVSSGFNVVSETKDFIALNRNMSRARLRFPSKPENYAEANRRFCTGKNDSLATQRNPVRKRRSLNANRPADNARCASSLLEKEKSNKGNIMTGSGPRNHANLVSQPNLKSKPATQRRGKDTDVVSFTFSSPIKSSSQTFSHDEMRSVKRRDQIGSVVDENLLQKLMMEENGLKGQPQNSLLINEDALGALLEQKLKELTYQVENEAATGFTPSSRTTASILQELISALTAERPISSRNGAYGRNTQDSESGGDIVDGVSQAKSRIKRSSDGFSCEVDRFSPGCVLEASFSNESCFSSSIDDASAGHIQQSDSTDLSRDSVPLTHADADLVDSASSATKPRSGVIMVVADLLNHTPQALQNANLAHPTLTGTKLDFVQEILLNTELLFGNAYLHTSSRFIDFLLGPFLDELETLVIAAWKSTVILGFEVTKEENPLRKFLFDCLIECLDEKYSNYSNSGYKAFSRIPKCINAEVLIQEFDEEVRKWISLAGKSLDEIIEREMSVCLGKWTDFEIEEFETGTQIDQDIVQTLVDEIVIDLCGSELSFC